VVEIRALANTEETSEVTPKRKKRASLKAKVSKEKNEEDAVQGRIIAPSDTTLA
jgi:hypothetical protein